MILGLRLSRFHVCVSRSIFALCISLTTLHQPANAQSSPPGELIDVLGVDGDNSLICTFNLKKKKVETYLLRVDGKKLFKKPYWTSKTIKTKYAQASKAYNDLKSRNAPKKKLKKAKQDKAEVAKARNAIKLCAKGQNGQSIMRSIQFDHVKNIIQTQCMSCHGVLGWENSEQYFLSSGKVTPGDLAASSLYTFLSNNPEKYQPAYMPKGLAPLSPLKLQLMSRWIEDSAKPGQQVPATPTPGGEEGEGRDLYNNFCSSCHGNIQVSAKYGRTAAQIRAALSLGGIPQMRFLNLSDEQLRKIALALSRVQPPEEGTVSIRSAGPAQEGNSPSERRIRFEAVLTGTSSQPFTVGYVTTNGSALAGSDFRFTVGTIQFQGRNGEVQPIEIEILGDTIQEGDETLFVDIGGVSHGGIRVGTSTASGTILNDDSFALSIPPQASQVRMAYGFNGNFNDALGISNGMPQGDAVISTQARVGSGALELDAGADHLLVSGANLTGMSGFTFAGWVNWQNSTSTTSRVFDFGLNTGNYISFAPKDANNRCRFELRGNGTATFTLQCATNVALPANQWVHVATTFNAATDEMKIFFNGQQVATRTGVTAEFATLTLTDNKIGKSRVAGSTDFAGLLDEMTIWDGALSQVDVAAHMAMNQSASFNSGVEVRLNGQLLANGSAINFGTLSTGEELNLSLFISNRGPATLGLTGLNQKVEISGRDANNFTSEIQPWPWQHIIGVNSVASFSLRYAPTIAGNKNATLIVSNSDLQNGNYAVTLSGNAVGDPLPEPPQSGGGSSPLEQARYLYAVNCSSCHGAIARSQKAGLTVERLNAALAPGTGVPQMRGLALTSSDIQQIVTALNAPPPPATTSTKVEDSVLPLGTAKYVASVLTDIFLPEDTTTFTANDNTILSKIGEIILGRNTAGTVFPSRVRFFGGRCERFDDICQAEALLNSQRPIPNAARSGYILRACDDILSIDRSVDNVMAKIQRTTTSPLNPEMVSAVYDLFYPGKPMPAYLSDVVSTYTVGMPNFTPLEHKRFLIHLICASSDWEAQ